MIPFLKGWQNFGFHDKRTKLPILKYIASHIKYLH
uniref:Uncharacterized protein n=1 Tax=Rhizophora mucronata TaxID=61149 RepID=A0A2P2P9B6_RHIMU